MDSHRPGPVWLVTASPRTVLTVFVGAHVINDFYATVLPAFLPALATEFNLNYTELGVLTFAFTLFTGVLQPVLGSTADRRGRRRWILVFGFVVAAVGFLAMAVAPTFWFIVVVSLLGGLGAATYHPQATAFIVAAYPDRRGRMLGIHGWGGSAGHFLAPAVVVITIAAFNWRVAMAIIAIPMVLTALLLRTTLDETKPNPSISLRGTSSRALLVTAVALGVMAVIGRSYTNFFVKMLVDEGWEETSAGVVLTIILLGGAVAQPVGGWAYDNFGGRQVFTVAAVATTLLVALFIVSSGAVSLIAVAGVAFFQFSLFPVGLAQASALASSDNTGGATGLTFGISGLMAATAQPVVGAMGEAFGDIRVALGWLWILGVVSILLSRMMPNKAESDATTVSANASAARQRDTAE